MYRESQVTDRYTKAIEQLGSEKRNVRIGGLYALERIARDSARDHPTVMEVLAAFIREHRHDRERPQEPGADVPKRNMDPDVQAALSIIGRRNRARDIRPIDLTGADLSGADLAHADLSGADLTRADLTDATCAAKLTRANLSGADLTDADLSSGTDLIGSAILAGAHARVGLTGKEFLEAINRHRLDILARSVPRARTLPARISPPARTSPARISAPQTSPARTLVLPTSQARA